MSEAAQRQEPGQEQAWPDVRARCQAFLDEYAVMAVVDSRPGIGKALVLQLALKLLARNIIDEDMLAGIVIDAAEYYDFERTGKLPAVRS